MQEKSLSERQKEILAEIIKFKKENGFSPTVRELCAFCGAQRPQMRFRAAALRSKTATRLMQVISC